MGRDYTEKTKICIDCGEVIVGCGNTRKRCPSCARQKILADKRQAARELYNQRKTGSAPPKKKKRMSLDQTIKAASKAGMSYGMYQAMIYEQEERH